MPLPQWHPAPPRSVLKRRMVWYWLRRRSINLCSMMGPVSGRLKPSTSTLECATREWDPTTDCWSRALGKQHKLTSINKPIVINSLFIVLMTLTNNVDRQIYFIHISNVTEWRMENESPRFNWSSELRQ